MCVVGRRRYKEWKYYCWWIKGENVPQGNVIDPNESTIIELKDGYLLLNIRNQSETKCRAVSKSNSGIDNWSLAQLDTSLIDPVCFASAAKFKNKILFVNCNSRVKREKLSVQLFDNSFSTSILTKTHQRRRRICWYRNRQ